MAFRIECNDWRYGMRAYCDHCGKEVKAGDCNVLSRRDIANGESMPIVIACKDQCTQAIDPKKKLANQELGACLLQAVINTNSNLEEERRWASILE